MSERDFFLCHRESERKGVFMIGSRVSGMKQEKRKKMRV